MKRCFVVGVRENQDEKTKENILFVTLCQLPSKMKNGGLWYPKKADLITTACFGEQRHPSQYKEYKTLGIGSLVDVVYGVNEFTGTVFVANLTVKQESVYTDADLFN